MSEYQYYEFRAIDKPLKRPFWERWGLSGAGGGYSSSGGNYSWLQSDHCFDDLGLISPVSNPFLFEDPRALTELRPIFMYQLSNGAVTVKIEEQPIPMRQNGRAGMIRNFTVEGPPRLSLDILGQNVVLDNTGRAQTEVEVTW